MVNRVLLKSYYYRKLHSERKKAKILDFQNKIICISMYFNNKQQTFIGKLKENSFHIVIYWTIYNHIAIYDNSLLNVVPQYIKQSHICHCWINITIFVIKLT